ncbi:MAG: PspC domain-containing protein [Defluviitaleaceae bacterium]|nr:PspC domain-containing protein [Defluviitaleaceae bacterium]MCL2836470.1 PspC domain-containing protein [Defluviitaleaceae bacterium]
MKKQLYKSSTNKKVAGVCGGIAEYFNIDATIVRLIAVCAVIFAGSGLLAYIICALVMPNAPEGYYPPPPPPSDQGPYNN